MQPLALVIENLEHSHLLNILNTMRISPADWSPNEQIQTPKQGFRLVSNDVPIFKARLSIYAYMRSYTTIMTKTHFAIFILYVYKHVYNVCMYIYTYTVIYIYIY